MVQDPWELNHQRCICGGGNQKSRRNYGTLLWELYIALRIDLSANESIDRMLFDDRWRGYAASPGSRTPVHALQVSDGAPAPRPRFLLLLLQYSEYGRHAGTAAPAASPLRQRRSARRPPRTVVSGTLPGWTRTSPPRPPRWAPPEGSLMLSGYARRSVSTF